MVSKNSRVALVVVDVQNAIDDPAWGPRNNPGAEQEIAELLALWRQHQQPVVHVRHDSTEPASPYRPGQIGNDFKPQAQPLDGETIVAKQTNSAFIDTELADILRECCDSVVYAGVITNNSIEATVRMSGNLGFESFVVADACWTVDTVDLNDRTWPAEDVHALSLANLHGEYATVISAADAQLLLEPLTDTHSS